MEDLSVEKILRAVECVSEGHVVTYGSIAHLVGSHARVVGRVMAQWGSGVPWWRVVNAGGLLPEHLMPKAVLLWAQENTPLTENGHVDVPAAHMSLHALSCVWEEACKDLPLDR